MQRISLYLTHINRSLPSSTHDTDLVFFAIAFYRRSCPICKRLNFSNQLLFVSIASDRTTTFGYPVILWPRSSSRMLLIDSIDPVDRVRLKSSKYETKLPPELVEILPPPGMPALVLSAVQILVSDVLG